MTEKLFTDSREIVFAEAEHMAVVNALKVAKERAEQAEQDLQRGAASLEADLTAAQAKAQQSCDDVQHWRTRCTGLEHESSMQRRQAAEASDLQAKELAAVEDLLGAKGPHPQDPLANIPEQGQNITTSQTSEILACQDGSRKACMLQQLFLTVSLPIELSRRFPA